MFKKKLLSVILSAAVLFSVFLSPFINTRFSETSGNVYADGGWSFGVEQFVRGLYQGCLEREPEWDGLSYWCTGLASGQVTGKEAARGFFFSSEFRRIIPMLTEEEIEAEIKANDEDVKQAESIDLDNFFDSEDDSEETDDEDSEEENGGAEEEKDEPESGDADK